MSAAALEGDLRHFYTTEVLQFLQLAGATGRLEFERANERVELFLSHGRPVFARASGPAVRTGDVLLHRRRVSREALERALAAQSARPGQRLGSLLVEGGAATRDDVAQAVGEVLRRIVYGLLLWTDGRFRFEPGPARASDDLEPDLDVDRLILEGLRRADETHVP